MVVAGAGTVKNSADVLSNPPSHLPAGRSANQDWIWCGRPPAEAANALQRLVARLRKALPDGAVRPARDPQGLGCCATPSRCGAAMQDVGLPGSAAFDAEVTRLKGLRLAAVEDRFDAEIALVRSCELVTELTDLVATHPVRERLATALMRALVARVETAVGELPP